MENQESISKMGMGVAIYGSPMSEITIYGSPISEITIYDSPMSESRKGTEVCNWKVLESTQRFLKILEHSQADHVSQGSEVREVGV